MFPASGIAFPLIQFTKDSADSWNSEIFAFQTVEASPHVILELGYVFTVRGFDMVKPKFYRDPVQLQIRFDPVDLSKAAPKDSRALSWLAQKIIATPQFQRLRFIRQNGLANFVFHGAEHSRFTHSMGVHAVARRMYECICRNCSEKEDDEWKLTSAVSALAHDIGHGPFSHTLEEILKENDIKFDHEEMTKRFLVEDDSPICKALKEVDAVLPSKLEMYFDKTKRGEDNWAYKIVSSQLDADRLDYVQRDALYAGLRGHGFDFERLLDLLSHHDNKIAVHRGAIIALESYLVAIDQMYRSIYYHRTVRAATQMLLSLFKRAVFLHKNGDKGIFPDAHDGVRHPMNDLIEHGSKVPLDRYVNLTEFGMWHLIDLWQRHKDQILRDLASRILRRDLFKAIQLNTTDYRGTRQLENNAKKLVTELFPKIEGVENFFVLYDDPSRTSYKRYNWKAESPSESIWLVDPKREPTPLEDDEESLIVQSFKKSTWFPRLIVPAEVRDKLTK